jgi:hypothetical protein
LNFYIRDKPNVVPIYTTTDDTDSVAVRLAQTQEYDLLFHGFHDSNRNDKYKNVFGQKFFSSEKNISECDIHFVKLFYELYDIPYSTRINFFDFARDTCTEDIAYSKFLQKCPGPYAVTHNGKLSEKTDFCVSKSLYDFNIDGQFKNIFASIKILYHASEMHFVDSMWASFCYLLDCKFGLFKNIPIRLYPYKTRAGGCIPNLRTPALEPHHPVNWTIVKQ